MKAAVATNKDGGVARRAVGGAKDGGGGAKEWDGGNNMYKSNDAYSDVFNHKFTFRHAVSLKVCIVGDGMIHGEYSMTTMMLFVCICF